MDVPLVEHPDSVVIVAVEGDQLVCVRQPRRGPDGPTLELPSGKLEADESPAEAAPRELAEECGLAAREWEEIGAFWAAPSYSTEYVHVWVASDLYESAPARPDDDDEVEVARVPLAGVLARLSDATSVAALALWLDLR